MSGASEATAVMTSREAFAVTPTTVNSPAPALTPAASQPQLEQQIMPYAADGAADAYRQVGSSPPPLQSIPIGAVVINHVMNMNSADGKRKRGRPRKYGLDSSMAISLASPQQPSSAAMPLPQPQSFSHPGATPPSTVPTEHQPPVGGLASPTVKKVKGRPPGSSNKKLPKEATGSNGGIGFIPYALKVNAGEDVSSKIMAFSRNGPGAICVLSATGAISNVTLRQVAASGGTATYEGRFDILSLTGSFMLSEVAGRKSRTGGLSIALAGPEGRVLGGSVAGLLVAASPVQVMVGSFLPDGPKEAKINYTEPSSAPPKMNLDGAAGASSSPSTGTPSDSSGGPASPLNVSSDACNNIPQGMSSMPWK